MPCTKSVPIRLEPRVGDDATRDGIHLPAVDPNGNRIHRGGLGRTNGFVSPAHVIRHIADEEGAGHVGPIPVDDAAEVEEQDVAGFDRRASECWPCGIAARGPARAIVGNASPSAPLARKNASSSQATSCSVIPGWTNWTRCEAVVAQRAGAADGVELVIGLDQPQRNDLVVHRVELDTGRRSGQRGPVGVRQHLGLHAERDDLEALEDRRQVLADSAGREDDLPPGCLPLGLLGVARIGQQQRSSRVTSSAPGHVDSSSAMSLRPLK